MEEYFSNDAKAVFLAIMIAAIIIACAMPDSSESNQIECPSPRELVTFTGINGNEVSVDPASVIYVRAFGSGDQVDIGTDKLRVAVLGTHNEVMTALGRP